MQNIYCYFDLNTFFCSVETIRNQELKNIPFVVGKNVVSSSNEHARKLGIFSGMPLFKCLKIFPNLTIIEPDLVLYNWYSKKFFEILQNTSKKIIHNISIDEGWIIFPATKHSKKQILSLIRGIRLSVWNELKLTINIGIGYQNFIAKMATKLNKPNGVTICWNEEEFKNIFWKQEIDFLPGIGQMQKKIFHKLGIKTIENFCQFNDKELLINTFKNQYHFWQDCAYGKINETINTNPINKYCHKSISASKTAKEMTNNFDYWRSEIHALSEQVFKRLINLQMFSQSIEIKIKSHFKEKPIIFYYHQTKNLDFKKIFQISIIKFDEFLNSKKNIKFFQITLKNLSINTNLSINELNDNMEKEKIIMQKIWQEQKIKLFFGKQIKN